jgi:hypothetical protein
MYAEMHDQLLEMQKLVDQMNIDLDKMLGLTEAMTEALEQDDTDKFTELLDRRQELMDRIDVLNRQVRKIKIVWNWNLTRGHLRNLYRHLTADSSSCLIFSKKTRSIEKTRLFVMSNIRLCLEKLEISGSCKRTNVRAFMTVVVCLLIVRVETVDKVIDKMWGD